MSSKTQVLVKSEESVEEIFREECPVCYNEVMNDVYCTNKHIVCAKCYLTICHLATAHDSVNPRCPICRVYLCRGSINN